MSHKVTSAWWPGAYLANERYNGCQDGFQEQHVLSGVRLVIVVTLAKTAQEKPYLFFRKISAPEKHG